jgi:hypothetical protein
MPSEPLCWFMEACTSSLCARRITFRKIHTELNEPSIRLIFVSSEIPSNGSPILTKPTYARTRAQSFC